MRIIIAGGRDFNDYSLLEANVEDFLIENYTESIITIVSGMAKGADALGIKYAKDYNYPVLEYKAEWDKYGKSAGFIRNKQMAEVADALIAFWDGKSSGTKNMIEEAEKENLIIKIINY